MLLNIIILGLIFAVSTAYVRISTTDQFDASEEKCQLKHSNLAIVTRNDDFLNGQANCAHDSSTVSCWTGLTRASDSDPWFWIGSKIQTTTDPASYGFNTQGVPTNTDATPTNTDGNPWYMENGSPTGSGNCVIFDKDHGFKWTITSCTAVAYPLCNLRKHVFKSSCAGYVPQGGCTAYETGVCTFGCGLVDGVCTGPGCSLVDGVCTTPCTTWNDKAPYKTPRYFTNGVVVALVGAIDWGPSTTAMGTGSTNNNIILQIKNPQDCPYFAQEFSVTNVDGIDCVVRVEPVHAPNDGPTTHCNVILESWSAPIVYVRTEGTIGEYEDKSWFVENVQQIADPNLGVTAKIFHSLAGDNAGKTNGKSLILYSWVEFDGIIWIGQGSNLDKGSGMLEP
eukprot:54040_1